MWEPGSLAPVCVFCWGELTLFPCLFSRAAAGTGEKRGLRNTKVQILPYIFALCVFFCVFLSTFALIKEREFQHFHIHVEGVPEASLGMAEPLERGPPWHR